MIRLRVRLGWASTIVTYAPAVSPIPVIEAAARFYELQGKKDVILNFDDYDGQSILDMLHLADSRVFCINSLRDFYKLLQTCHYFQAYDLLNALVQTIMNVPPPPSGASIVDNIIYIADEMSRQQCISIVIWLEGYGFDYSAHYDAIRRCKNFRAHLVRYTTISTIDRFKLINACCTPDERLEHSKAFGYQYCSTFLLLRLTRLGGAVGHMAAKHLAQRRMGRLYRALRLFCKK